MQKDLAPDIELNLKKRARRRLVGAIALVLILIALLPFLLKDRSTELSNDNVEISLQSNETSVNEVPEDLPNDFDSSVVPAQPSQPEPAKTESQAIDLPKPVKEEPVDTVKQPAKEQNPTKSQAKPVKPEPEKPKIVEKPTPKKTEPKPKPVKSTAKPKVTKVETAKTSGFYIQVGAFADAEKVKQLQAKMRELGYASRTENVKTDKGNLIRLKSGDFSNRNEAVIALENMKDAGLSGMVRSQ